MLALSFPLPFAKPSHILTKQALDDPEEDGVWYRVVRRVDEQQFIVVSLFSVQPEWTVGRDNIASYGYDENDPFRE